MSWAVPTGSIIIPFIPNGFQNGKPTWSGETNNTQIDMEWSIQNSRWEIPNWNQTTGIPISNNQTDIPTNGWSMTGPLFDTIITVVQGNCLTIPLSVTITSQDSTCNLSNNGSILINPNFGSPVDYEYSIDGINYQYSNTFQTLNPGTYTITTRDIANPQRTTSNQVTIGVVIQNTNYTVGVNVIGISTPTTGTRVCQWEVKVTPQLPSGISITFNLNVNTNKRLFAPGSGTIVDNTVVTKNTTPISTTPGATNITTTLRPGCGGLFDLTTSARTDTYTITLGSGESVSGTSTSVLSITNGVVAPNSCATRLQQDITINTTSPTITGGVCYNITNLPQPEGITNHQVSFGFTQND
jgi:hypothetical protein